MVLKIESGKPGRRAERLGRLVEVPCNLQHAMSSLRHAACDNATKSKGCREGGRPVARPGDSEAARFIAVAANLPLQ